MLSHHYETQLLQTRLEVQEQAFKYLSEEIHDNVGQVLSLVKLHLYSLNKYTREPDSEMLIKNSTDLLSKAIADLRNISHNLNGKYIAKTGLKEAVQKELNYTSSAKSMNGILHIKGDTYPLDPEKELLIFRIIQEAIANAIKHAQAKNIDIYIEYLQGAFSVSIADDGQGFDITHRSVHHGLGLDNMKVRAELLKGSLHIDTAINKGTKITLLINTEDHGQGS